MECAAVRLMKVLCVTLSLRVNSSRSGLESASRAAESDISSLSLHRNLATRVRVLGGTDAHLVQVQCVWGPPRVCINNLASVLCRVRPALPVAYIATRCV